MASYYNLRPLGTIHLGGYAPSAPEVPEASPIQTTLPTSAYGQTIPVVWGKARVPGAYIWVPPIVTITETHTEWWDQITTTTSDMSCRLRFARPLVPDSTWTLRRLWSNGTLIYDASQNYRKKGLNFRFYDGRSTQPRDQTMTREEGTNNVSAHRGYIDIVITDFDIQGFGAPPVFEAEVIQDGASTHEYDDFLTYQGSISFNKLLPVWDQNKMYGLYTSGVDSELYSLSAARQYFSFTMGSGSEGNYFQNYRYSKALDRLIVFTSTIGIDFTGKSYDGSTGELKGTAGSTCKRTNGCCLVDMGQASLVVSFTDDARVYVFQLLINTPTGDVITLATDTGINWLGYTVMDCVTPGEIRPNDFDVYFCAGSDLLKATFFSTGILKSQSVLTSVPGNLRYAVYDGGDIVAWNDSASLFRVDGSTGAITYTKTVPYQIEASSEDIIGTRTLADPDLNRFAENLYYGSGSNSYFTDLSTGTTITVTGRNSTLSYYVYDGQTSTVYTKRNSGSPVRLRFISGDGNSRLLADFLEDLMVYGGGYDPADIVTENIDDAIQGAVVDITAGARDIARSVIEPYSIAMFER